MKPETPVLADVRAVDVGYFSTKLTLGRKLEGNVSTIASMKPETPVVVDVRAVDVGYFSTKLTLGRKLGGNASTIATA